MAATTGHRLTLDPMGKYSNAFFSETTNMIKAKLDRLREDDTNGGIREKKGRFKSKIFVKNYISLKFRYMYV
jgi:hypothetical protein